MRSFFILIFFVFYIGCVENRDLSLLKVINVNEIVTEDVNSFYNGLLISNSVFAKLDKKLKEKTDSILIILSDTVDLGGAIFHENNEIKLYFRSLNELKNENMLTEELFHVFQFFYYGNKRFSKYNDGKIIGGANIEFEAKLFKSLMYAVQDRPFNETPSQKGLVEFTMTLLDTKGQLAISTLTRKQHLEYIKLVKHFRKHWEIRNFNEHKSNVYDHPVDENLGPNACFDILSSLKVIYF